MNQTNRSQATRTWSRGALIFALIAVAGLVFFQWVAKTNDDTLRDKGIIGGTYYDAITGAGHNVRLYSWIFFVIVFFYAGFLQFQHRRKVKGAQTTNLTTAVSFVLPVLLVVALLIIRQF